MKPLKPSLPGESRREYLARTCDHQWESHGGAHSGPCPIPVCSMCGTVKKTSYPDDKLKELVEGFAEALLAKLIAAEMKYGWNNGWAKPVWEDDCRRHLLEHVAKGDPLDVAAYAAFCWHHGWGTSLTKPPFPGNIPDKKLATDWYTWGFQSGMEAEKKSVERRASLPQS